MKKYTKRISPLGWHGIYFATICLVASFIFYGIGRRVESRRGPAVPGSDGSFEQMDYLDALFLGVTSATGAGLVNVGFPSCSYYTPSC